ncbi:MAG: hypothetical protein PHQ65_08715 [Bacteroidales bacterium]|jgi:hypothetical protein|nr:hypothetical protein [Bacteroidales bacterium]MDD3665333.1 hypothetical protein [Bacteroidales bacterium]
MNRIKLIGLIIILVIATACNNHFMSLTMLQEQLEIEKLDEISRKKIINYGMYEFFKVSYKPNGLWEVICMEKKTGKKVALTINKDTVLVITDKSGKKHRLYFDTVHIYENKIYGLYSRFINDPKTIDFDYIEKIEIHAEMSKSRDV